MTRHRPRYYQRPAPLHPLLGCACWCLIGSCVLSAIFLIVPWLILVLAAALG